MKTPKITLEDDVAKKMVQNYEQVLLTLKFVKLLDSVNLSCTYTHENRHQFFAVDKGTFKKFLYKKFQDFLLLAKPVFQLCS